MNAQPAKLKSGEWGARVASENVSVGDSITITTKAGKSWDARVSRVLWSGNGVSICATGNSSMSTASHSRGHGHDDGAPIEHREPSGVRWIEY